MLSFFHSRTGPRNKCGDKGFTLLEMTVVLVIISTVAAGAIAYLTVSLERRGLLETQHKLEVIQATLMNFRLANNRLPCPALFTDAVDSANFGKEGTAGTCPGVTTDAGSTTALGMLPTQTLGLPDDYAFDGWGRRMEYAVVKVFTGTDGFISNSVNNVVAGMMTVNSTAGSSKTSTAIYAVVSFGADGHGAYTRRGTAGTKISTGSVNAGQLANCACDNAAVGGTFGDVLYQGLPQGDPTTTSYFDDMVIYETRASMRSTTE
jgi:prepilin-type N-terminal cleavage/methylation domain-containing protein